MPSPAGQLKKLYQQILGGVAPSGAASVSGDVSQMVKYVVANMLTNGASPQRGFSDFLGHYTNAADVTISSNIALTERVNYFRNLTINNGIVLTGIAGGTIIVVEDTLTFGNASSQISVDALGAKGGAGQAASRGLGGGGGGTGGESGTNFGFATDNTNGSSVVATLGPTDALLSNFFPSGNGPVGAAWSSGTGAARLADISLVFMIMDLITKRSKDDATSGAIGGGGGGGGGTGNSTNSAAPSTGQGAHGPAGSGSSINQGGRGGSGFGNGGAGGTFATSTGGGGTGATGGRGGGVVLIYAKNIVAASGGLVTANGGNGNTGSSTVSSGGGGGGGAVVLLYESVSGSLPTLQANGGAGGTGASAPAGTGGAGGAGLTEAIKIRAGV